MASSCHRSEQRQTEKKAFNCNLLTNKKYLLALGDSIIEKHDNNKIWNLSNADTTEFFTIEDYFTNNKTKNRIVVLGGNAGISAGSAHHLFMLFECKDTFKILWSAQEAPINDTCIADLNNDGIMEIVTLSGATWQGTSWETYEIFNFKDNKKNVLYSSQSNTVIDCGGPDLGEAHKPGDTLELQSDHTLVPASDKHFSVKQIRTIKIHNGGSNTEEVLKNIKIIRDTIVTRLY